MKHTCPQCKKEFEGRRNKKYCSPTCKNEAYYAKDEELHRHNRHGLANMTSNHRIVLSYIANKKLGVHAKISKSDLTAFGFNEHGPFWYQDRKLRIGKFLLEDAGSYYVLHYAYSGLGYLSNKT
jgi:hypothetical protein